MNSLLVSLALVGLLTVPTPDVPTRDVPLPRRAPAPHAGPVFDGRRGQLKVSTPRRDAAAVTDGKLEEAEWNSAALLTGFSQFFPLDGVPAQDSTEVLVWYTATALHVGIRAHAPAGTVRATLSDRDRITQDDNVQLFLGTYGDSRQAMVFSVNPLGIQSDGVLIETGSSNSGGFQGATAKSRESTDLAPDYVWQSKGRLTEYGYEVEIAIPFKSLRYRAGDEQQWQLNIIRTVQATGHEESWAPA
ncbi:MAG: carbohydrate binding family 9 domain-containing protein, partial [Gemmatimonadaceae bacterium]|nr:carbohydrate binding family 9 domain-containing protein [Gemmatimonadaceae bacterium]